MHGTLLVLYCPNILNFTESGPNFNNLNLFHFCGFALASYLTRFPGEAPPFRFRAHPGATFDLSRLFLPIVVIARNLSARAASIRRRLRLRLFCCRGAAQWQLPRGHARTRAHSCGRTDSTASRKEDNDAVVCAMATRGESNVGGITWAADDEGRRKGKWSGA